MPGSSLIGSEDPGIVFAIPRRLVPLASTVRRINVLCAVLEVLGDQERDFQGLRVVQTRVAQRLVAVSQ